MKNKKEYIIIVVAIALIAIGKITYDQYQIKTTYEKAINEISNADYISAVITLRSIEEEKYRDTESWITYCEAHILYDEGKIDTAHRLADSLDFKYQTAEQQEETDTFISKLEQKYDGYLEKKKAEEKRAYEAKIRTGVPFVGMSEHDITKTSLGVPSPDVRHNNECINGEQYTANLYDFYNGSNIVFTARCVQGKVTNVWDYRDDPVSTSSKANKLQSSTSSSNPYKSYDEGYEDVYYDEDYDWDRYWEDDEYADGVDDAMEDGGW